ncbi:hypothetical protein KBD20_03320 [Candidatus Saccharibacteria bacterium]|nr:hypothetical protein [Candidatus Saccharibacteria bacterium]
MYATCVYPKIDSGRSSFITHSFIYYCNGRFVEDYDYYAFLGSKNVLNNALPLFIEYDPFALEECGSSANKFADMIYDRYPIAYIID